MGMFDHFPYTNFHELNLDWILQALKEIEKTMDQFVTMNAIKYADPIQWDITRQYEKNTIVIDPLTGTAYLSVKPVPTGVSLSRTEYWTVVFDLSLFIVRAAKNFTDRYEADTTLTATFPTPVGGWLVWGDTLYRAATNITAGDSYVIGGNIVHFTMETEIQAVRDIIGLLSDLNTTDKTNIVAAINEIVENVTNEAQARLEADTALQEAINEEVQARQDADTTLQEAIDDEAQARQDADDDLRQEMQDIVAFASLATYNVSGTDNEYYGNITANATNLSFNSAHNYNVGEGMLIERAGRTPTLSPVQNFAATFVGTAGNVTHTYSIAKITRHFGCTPAVSVTVRNCAATFDRNNYVRLSFAQDANAYAYILYKDGILVDILSQNIVGGCDDWQLSAIEIPFNIPSAPPVGYVNEYLKATVVEIDTAEVIIDTAAYATVNGARIIHDDTDEIQRAINENELLYIPSGHYNVSIVNGIYNLVIPSNREIYGDGETSIIYSHFGYAHGAILFNSCNVYGGTNRNIKLRNFAIRTNAVTTNHVCGISFRIPSIYMATNVMTNKPHDIYVEHMYIRGVSGGITFASIVNGAISHNDIADCIADGAGCYDACEHCVIEYNNVYNTGDDSITSSNSTTTYNTDIKIIGNYVAQSGAHGIRCEGTANTVAYNMIEYTAMDGIFVHKYDRSLTHFNALFGNKMFRVGTYLRGIGGGLNAKSYDILLTDDNGSSVIGFLSQISIIGNNLNDTDAIGIIGNNPTNPITNVQIASNPTIADGEYEIDGVIMPNNIHSFSQRVKGQTSISVEADTLASQTVTFQKLPLVPSISIERTNGIGSDTFNYWISNITDHSFTINLKSANTATFTFNFTATA